MSLKNINSLSKRGLAAVLISLQFCLPLWGAETKSAYNLPREPGRPRDDIAAPLMSFLLPGLDQWWEEQYLYGAIYTGLGAGALTVAFTYDSRDGGYDALYGQDDESRWQLLGMQTFSTAGALSMYHAFRSAARSRQPTGYSFITVEESPKELALSAFRFDYLVRPTTFVPLILLGGLVALAASSPGNDWTGLKGRDAIFIGGFSYNAGLWEELAFRGYLTQMLYEKTDKAWVAHLLASSVFAAAHLSSRNKFPIAQFVGGLYWGWLSQHNDWTLSEGIFIHTWWDVIALTAVYALNKENVLIPLPGFSMTF